MTQQPTSRFSKLNKGIAASVSAALILTAPGLPVYRAFAQFRPIAAGGNAGVVVPVAAPHTGTFGGPMGAALNGAMDLLPGGSITDGLPGMPGAGQTQAGRAAAAARRDGAPLAPTAAQAAEGREAPGGYDLAGSQETIERVAESLGRKDVSPASAWQGGHRAMEPLIKSRVRDGAAVVVPDAVVSRSASPRASPAMSRVPSSPLSSAAVPEPKAPAEGSKVVAALKMAVTVGVSAAAVVAVQAVTASFVGGFGMVPVTAAWLLLNTAAVAVMFNPAKMRLQLARSKAEGLGLARRTADVAIGLTLGGVAVAVSALAGPALGELPGELLKGIQELLSGTASYGVISAGPLLGLMGLAGMSTMSFALPFITGKREPSPQAMNFFPRFLWMALGVPFALASGFAAPGFVNYAFVAWQLSAAMPKLNKFFTWAWAGTFVAAAVMGFQTPLAFLALMFTAERAVHFTLAAIRRSARTEGRGQVGKGDDYVFEGHLTHPNTGERIARLESGKMVPGARDPYKYKLKTVLLMGSIFAMAVAGAQLVFGWAGFWVPLAIGSALTGVMWYFSHKVAVKMFGGIPYKDAVARIPRLEVIHAMLEKRAKQMGLPKTPEFYLIPADRFPGPNAFATGRNPANAVVAVTEGILEIMDDRELEGVLSHELYHVAHRDILLGTITGAVGTAVNWASYKIMWMVSTGRILVLGGAAVAAGLYAGIAFVPLAIVAAAVILALIPSRKAQPKAEDKSTVVSSAQGPVGGQQAQVFPAAGGALAAMPFILKVFASIWLPYLLQLLQMGHTRNREFYADQDGALLLGDGKPLADGLRKLAGFKPKALTADQLRNLPMAFALGHLMIINPLEQFGEVLGEKPEPPGGGGTSAAPRAPPGGPGILKSEGPPGGDTSARAHGPGIPGIDAGLLPAVAELEALASAPARKDLLAHVVPALTELLSDGGSVKFGTAEIGEGRIVPVLYADSSRTVVVTESFRRVHPKLMAAVLGQQVQAAYDARRRRTAPIRETALRQLSVIGALLEGIDLKALAAELNINNPFEVHLYKGLVRQKLQARLLALDATRINGPSAEEYAAELREVISDMKADAEDLRGRISRAVDAGAEGEAGSLNSLAAKLETLEALVFVAEERLELFAGEQPGRAALDVPARGEVAPVLPPKATVLSPKLEQAVAVLKSRIAGDSVLARRLSGVPEALDRLVADGAVVAFGPTPRGVGAFFDTVSRDLIVSDRFERAHALQIAALLVHELTHAADFYAGRALTLETEYNAFTNQGLFLEGVSPKALVREIDRSNIEDVELYHQNMHVRQMQIQGRVSVREMVRNAYTKKVHGDVEGLLDASQALEKLEAEALGPLEQELDALRGQAVRVPAAAAPLRARIDAAESVLALYLRQKAQYEAAIGARGDGFEPASAPKPQAGLPPLAIGGFGGFESLGPVQAWDMPDLGPSSRVLPPAVGPPVRGFVSRAAGFPARAWRWLVEKLRMVDDRRRNVSYWVLSLGQAAIMIGYSFLSTAMGAIAAQHPTQMGTLSAASRAASAASNVVTAPLVDRMSTKTLLFRTQLGRGALYAAVPLLMVTGFTGFWPFFAAMVMAAFVQSMSINAAKVALMKTLSKDEGAYTRAYSVLKLLVNVVSIVGPLMGGAFMGLMELKFAPVYGAGIGAALAIGVTGAFMVVAGIFYKLFLHLPEDTKPVVELRASDPRKGSGRWAAIKQGFALIMSSRFLRRTMYINAFEQVLARPVSYLVLAKLAEHVAKASAIGLKTGMDLPYVGWFLKAINTHSGAYGIFLSAESLGVSLSAALLLAIPGIMVWAHGSSRRAIGRLARAFLGAPLRLAALLYGRLPGTDLERQGRFSLYLSGVAHLLFWMLIGANGIYAAAAILMAISFLDAPEGVVWDGLVNKVIGEGRPEMRENRAKVLGALEFIETVIGIGGMLGVAAVVGMLSLPAALLALAVVMSVASALHFIEPTLVFPLEEGIKEKGGITDAK